MLATGCAATETNGFHPYSADMSKHAFLGSDKSIKKVQKDYAGKL